MVEDPVFLIANTNMERGRLLPFPGPDRREHPESLETAFRATPVDFRAFVRKLVKKRKPCQEDRINFEMEMSKSKTNYRSMIFNFIIPGMKVVIHTQQYLGYVTIRSHPIDYVIDSISLEQNVVNLKLGVVERRKMHVYDIMWNLCESIMPLPATSSLEPEDPNDAA